LFLLLEDTEEEEEEEEEEYMNGGQGRCGLRPDAYYLGSWKT
jgi:hypothetical protein